jgi:hypothetical protein
MAIKYLAGNRLTGVSGDTKPTSNVLTGTTFLETNTDDMYMWDSSSWNVVAGNTIAQTFSNKSFTSAGIELVESAAPGTPASGFGVMYVKTDNKIYFKSDAGIEYNLTESAAGTLLTGLEDTTITSPTDGAILAWDTGTSRWRDATISGAVTMTDVGAMTLAAGAVTDLSATTTVNNATDYVIMYDASATGVRKVTVANLVAGGVSSDTIALLNDTTIASVASANVLIYDGTDSWDNKAISGDITLGADGAVAIGSGVVVNADINASAAIEMSKTTLVAGTGITLSTNTLNVDAAQTQITSVGALDAGSISSNFGVINNGSSAITTSGAVTGGTLVGTITTAAQTNVTSVGALDGGSITSNFGTIDTGASNITTTGTVSAGNLTVTGTTTTVNSTVLTVVDPIIHLQTASGGGNLSADTNKDVGLIMEYHNGSAAKEAFLGWDDSASKLTFIPDASLSSEVVSGSVGTIVANLEGDVTGAVTGNADTATALATGRTVGMTGDITWTSASFTGSGNVTGTAAITADVIVNADINTGAGIVDTKLATISTADKVAGGAIQIDSGTDGTGITIVDADKLLIDDAGATKYINASQFKTYASGSSADESFAIAMAVAL